MYDVEPGHQPEGQVAPIEIQLPRVNQKSHSKAAITSITLPQKSEVTNDADSPIINIGPLKSPSIV
jgi:hypothetical protein